MLDKTIINESKQQTKAKKIISSYDLDKIKNKWIEIQNEDFKKKRSAVHTVIDLFKVWPVGEKVFWVSAIVTIIAMILMYIFSVIGYKQGSVFANIVIFMFVIGIIIMLMTRVIMLISDSAGYHSAIKKKFTVSDITIVTTYIYSELGIISIDSLNLLVSVMEDRKAQVELYRSNKSELIEALMTGMTALISLTGVAAISNIESKNGVIWLICMLTVIFSCLSGFFIKIMRNSFLTTCWSEQDEEILNLLHLLVLNAEALGFE